MRRCRFLPVLCVLLFAAPWQSYGQDQSPLTEIEEREILSRLLELKYERERTALLRKAMDDAEALRQREAELATRELEAEKSKTALAEKDAVMAKERAAFYEKAFTEATKGRSFGCKVAKIFTLGLARCR